VTRSIEGLSAALLVGLFGCETPHSVTGAASGVVDDTEGAGGGAGAGGPTFLRDGAAGGARSQADALLNPDVACVVQKQDSRPIPTDIFIMLDKSISMNCPATDATCDVSPSSTPPPTRWTAVTAGIGNFVKTDTNAGIGVGLSLFDYAADTSMCVPQNYVNSAIPIKALPAAGAAVLNRIAATRPGGVTPTLWALEGAIMYVRQYMAENPGKSAAVVFVTDGMPNSPLCPSTVQAAADVAQAAFLETPSIETYVVGMGATATLDQIALAGSGATRHYIDANGDPATALRDLLKLVSQPIACDYPIPTTSARLNYDAVDVQTRASVADPTITLKYVTSASDCTAAPAWYYDEPPPGTPTKITLCPSACDPLKGLTTATVQAVIGCAPRIN
jgi:hypothetical protein